MIISNLICAKRIIEDKYTNNISIVDIVNQIPAFGYPLFLSSFAIFFTASKTGRKLDEKVNIQILNNEKSIMEDKGISIHFGDKSFSNNIVQINGLAIKDPGELTVNLLYKKDILASSTIRLLQAKNSTVPKK